LPPEVEKEMVAHIIKLESCCFGMTINDCRKLAYEAVEKNGLKHVFNKDLKMAGKKWYYNFMKRYPDLSLRQPENTPMARAKGFCRGNVNYFFVIFETFVMRISLMQQESTTSMNLDSLQCKRNARK
jgi:hypothetical protein